MNRKMTKSQKLGKQIEQLALSYPEATESYPWGEIAIKVRNKTFLFMSYSEDSCGFSMKLPLSGSHALSLPFTKPTHYGLGKSGWVSFKFSSDEKPPIELLRIWLHESYLSIAPKRLSNLVPVPK